MGGTGGGNQKQTSRASESASLARIPSRRLGNIDPSKYLAPETGDHARREVERSPGPSPTHSSSSKRQAHFRSPPLAPRKPARLRSAPARPPCPARTRSRPPPLAALTAGRGSVRASAVPGPGWMDTQAGRGGSEADPAPLRPRAARALSAVGAPRGHPPDPRPGSRPRLTSVALPGPGWCGPRRAPSSWGRRGGRSGPARKGVRAAGAAGGPSAGRRGRLVLAPPPQGHG